VDEDALATALAAAGLDAVVAMSPRNVWYLSGHPRLNGSQRPGAPAPAVVIATGAGAPTLVVSRWHAGLAKGSTWTGSIVTYRNYAESAFLAVANELERKGLAGGQIGLELDYIVDHDYRELVGALPAATFRDFGAILDSVRTRRTAEHRAAVASAHLRLGEAVLRGLGQARRDDTRLRLHQRIMREALAAGTDTVRGGIAGLGEEVVPLVNTRAVPLSPGEWLTLDYTCTFGLYAARIRRTVVVDFPDAPRGAAGDGARPGFEPDYASLHDAVLSAVSETAPGCTAGELAVGVCSRLAAAGHPPSRPVLGHGLTLGFEEPPVIAVGSTDALAPGMEFVLEPRVSSGLAISARVTVTDTGLAVSDTGFPIDRPYPLGR
jgi:Xaa-Pro aminopeptidase